MRVEAQRSADALALANSVASVTSGLSHSHSNSISLDGVSTAGDVAASMGRNNQVRNQGRNVEDATQRQQRLQSLESEHAVAKQMMENLNKEMQRLRAAEEDN